MLVVVGDEWDLCCDVVVVMVVKIEERGHGS